MEEVIAATAYLELFIRKITEPALMETFLRFITTEKHDDVPILDSLISRIGTNTRVQALCFFWDDPIVFWQKLLSQPKKRTIL